HGTNLRNMGEFSQFIQGFGKNKFQLKKYPSKARRVSLSLKTECLYFSGSFRCRIGIFKSELNFGFVFTQSSNQHITGFDAQDQDFFSQTMLQVFLESHVQGSCSVL